MPPSSKPSRGLSRAIQTGNLVFLRYPTPRDRDEFLTLRRGCRKFLERWEPIPPNGFDSFGDDSFNRELKLRKTATEERLLICTRHDGVVVGKMSIGSISRGPLQSCYLGYWIGRHHAGNGYMTQALALTLRHCFKTLKLHRAEANIQPNNKPSQAVVKKNCFSQEGYSPKYLKIRGKWADHERWAITIEQWREHLASQRI